jgi:hypothetical protein
LGLSQGRSDRRVRGRMRGKARVAGANFAAEGGAFGGRRDRLG